MASTNNERCRKQAIRHSERTDQISCPQNTANPNAGPMPTPPICTVVNSIHLPISSVPVILNPSNNIQSLCTPRLNPAIRFKEFEENLQTLVKELQEAEHSFLEEVGKINTMDRMIFENASNLECLYLHLQEHTKTSKNFDTSVKKLFTELDCLEETVQNLERRFDGEINHHLDCYDGKQRENLYNFLIQLDTNIYFLVNQLSEAICLNNSSQEGSCHKTDPVEQIRCILNHNFDTLLHLENAFLESEAQMERLLCLQKEIQSKYRGKYCL